MSAAELGTIPPTSRSKIKLKNARNTARAARSKQGYDPDPPRCMNCKRYFKGAPTIEVHPFCSVQGTTVSANGVCDFWEGVHGEQLEAPPITASLAALVVPQWQDIAVEPVYDEELLVCSRLNRVSIVSGPYLRHMRRAAKADGDECYYTLWMPLPRPAPLASPGPKVAA